MAGLQASSQLGGFVNRNDKFSRRRGNADIKQADPNLVDSNFKTANQATKNESSPTSAIGDGQGDSSLISIAESKGNNWAVPNRKPDSVGYRRPIVIEIKNDEMVVNPQSDQDIRRINFDSSISESVEHLVTQVWQQVERWGVAGVNSYWKPELVFRVSDNGRQRYGQILELMSGSGLEIQEVEQ